MKGYLWEKGRFDIIADDEHEHKPHKETMPLPQLVAETFGYFVQEGLCAKEDIPSAEEALIYRSKTLKAWINL